MVPGDRQIIMMVPRGVFYKIHEDTFVIAMTSGKMLDVAKIQASLSETVI